MTAKGLANETNLPNPPLRRGPRLLVMKPKHWIFIALVVAFIAIELWRAWWWIKQKETARAALGFPDFSDEPPPFEVVYMGWTNSFTNFDEAAQFAPMDSVINIPNGQWDIATNLIRPEILTPDEGRVLSELTAELGPGEALRVFNRTKEAANIERSTRPPMPGVRQGIDTNRFPLFEEAP